MFHVKRYLYLKHGVMRFSYKNALSILSAFAEKEGFVVNTEHEFTNIVFLYANRKLNTPHKINIQKKLTYEHKVYYYLHELGHHMLRKNWNRYKKKFTSLAKAEENRTKQKFSRRIGYVVDAVYEEYLAWDEGYKLGIKLGIKLNEKKWVTLKNQCLKRYIEFYGRK